MTLGNYNLNWITIINISIMIISNESRLVYKEMIARYWDHAIWIPLTDSNLNEVPKQWAQENASYKILKVWASAIKDWILNQDALQEYWIEDQNSQLELPIDIFNGAIALHRWHLTDLLNPAYALWKEKISTNFEIQIGNKTYSLQRQWDAWKWVKISWPNVNRAFRNAWVMWIWTVVWVSAVNDPSMIQKNFSTVNTDNLALKDAQIVAADMILQKQEHPEIPTAVNILMAAHWATTHADVLIEAWVDLLFCWAWDQTPVVELMAKRVKEWRKMDTWICPIFHESWLMRKLLNNYFIPNWIIPPIIQFEDPGLAWWHELMNKPKADKINYKHTENFFNKAREAFEFLALKVESGELVINSDVKLSKAEIAKRIRNIKIAASWWINTHEKWCVTLWNGADMILYWTAGAHINEADADHEFSETLARWLDEYWNIITDPLEARKIITIKSPAWYPANCVDTPFTRQAVILQKAMHAVHQYNKKNDSKIWKCSSARSLPNDLKDQVFRLYDQWTEIPAWHHNPADFVQRITWRTRKCAAKCLDVCWLTTSWETMERKGIPKSSPTCILSPLSAAFHAGKITRWWDLDIPNQHLWLFFTWSNWPAFINRTSAAELVDYYSTWNIPTWNMLYYPKSTHSNEIFEMWWEAR